MVKSLPLPEDISAYAGYQWDEKSHHLQPRPELGEQSYEGLEVGLCRTEGALGGRIKVANENPDADHFTPDNIRKLQSLMGVSSASGVLILDRETSQPGHICIQATDPQWLKAMYKRVKSQCEDTLGTQDPKNDARCETLKKTLKTAAREESAWEKFVESLPVGTGFFVPGAIAGGLLMIGKSLFSFVKGAAPAIMVLPNCDADTWKDFPGICQKRSEEI